MELELCVQNGIFPTSHKITLFLYGIGASKPVIPNALSSSITLFLYGIGAVLYTSPSNDLQTYYIIPIWNWSWNTVYFFKPLERLLHYSYMELELKYFLICFPFSFHYIIPIWNWSPCWQKPTITLSPNYIIPIWNWSIVNSSPLHNNSTWLHYSYMELEQSSLTSFFGVVS